MEVFMTAYVVLFPSVLPLKVTFGYEPDYNDLLIEGNDTIYFLLFDADFI